MTRNLREEVDIAPYVDRGVIDVHDPAVRDNINTLLNGALGQCFITPYIALEKVRKVLAYYHIFLPKTTFLEGDHGVEVFDINQFGDVKGMRDNGDVVTRTDASLNLYFEYKMDDKGLFDIFCEIVTDEELDDLVDNVESEINDEDAEDDRDERLDEEQLDEIISTREITQNLSTPVSRKNLLKGAIQYRKETTPNDPVVTRAAERLKNPKYQQKSFGGNLTRKERKERIKGKEILARESSESVDMVGPETGYKQISGAPAQNMGNCSIGHNVLNKIKMKKKLEEDTKERDATWDQILKKNEKPKSTKENPNPASVARHLSKLTGKSHLKVVKEEDKKKVY